MKKLMIGLVAAGLCGAVSADIQSSNVVGYMTTPTAQDSNFRTVAFNTIGCNTADIQDIKISDDGAGSIGWGGEAFAIWEGAPSVVEGSGFLYTDPSLDPAAEATDYYWGDAEGNRASYSIACGQGIVIECSEGLDVTVSGQVPDEPVTFASVEGSNFTGNFYPAPMDIQNIKISDDGAGSIGWGGEAFAIWEGAPSVVEGSGFLYTDPSLDPAAEATDYYWGDADGNKASYSIPAGQGVVIECAEGLEITINPPIAL